MNSLTIREVTSMLVSIEKVDNILSLIDNMRNKDFLCLVKLEDDDILLQEAVNYPFKKMPKQLVSGVNRLGEIMLKNGATIDPSVKIEPPVVICSKAKIGYGCWLRPFSIIGKNCKIANVEINNSIIGDNAICAHGDYIGYSYIGQNCRIGSGLKTTTTIFKGVHKRPDEIILRNGISGRKILSIKCSHLGSIFEDGCLLGCNTMTMPGTYLNRGRYVPNVSLGGKKPGNRAAHISSSIFFRN